MTQRALEHLESFLERQHPGFADDAKLHAEARALSEAYTTGQSFSANAAAGVAYLAHFGPRAVVAVSAALASTHVPNVCVDVGAGSGASALALFLPPGQSGAGAKRVTLVERSAPALALAQKLLHGLGEVRVQAQPLESASPVGDAELVLSAFTFGELAGEPLEGWSALARLGPRAHTSVLVDAGDRPRARRIQELRDAIAVARTLDGKRVLAPCPHQDACPALLRARDWCHTRIDKALPERLARFARAVGRDDERMAAAYLVVGSVRDNNDEAREDAVLVIGEPLVEKGRVRLPVCGPGGLRFVQALKRHRAAHDALKEIPRGARLAGSLARETRDHTAHVEDEAQLQ